MTTREMNAKQLAKFFHENYEKFKRAGVYMHKNNFLSELELSKVDSTKRCSWLTTSGSFAFACRALKKTN